MAKVLAVDSEKMTMEVLPLAAGKTVHPDAESGRAIVVRIAEENNLTRNGNRAGLPGCVRIGETIRLWGRKDRNIENSFLATDIRGCRSGGCSDPTGVRSRLLQGRKKNQRFKKVTAPTEGQDSGTYGFDGDGHGGGGHGGGGSGGGGGGGGGGR